jgi:hypothetical protein
MKAYQYRSFGLENLRLVECDEPRASAHQVVMRCVYCHAIMMNGSHRTVQDDRGSLAITAWKCSSCDGVIEEIQILSRHGKVQPRPIRYTVKPQRSTRRLAQFLHDEPRSGHIQVDEPHPQ